MTLITFTHQSCCSGFIAAPIYCMLAKLIPISILIVLSKRLVTFHIASLKLICYYLVSLIGLRLKDFNT